MKSRLACAALIAVVAATSAAQDAKPADPPPEAAAPRTPTITPEAKAAFARMDALIDRPAAKGLTSMSGVIEGALDAGTVTVNFSFTAPATFTAGSSGKGEPGTAYLLELAVNGARLGDWADADAETSTKDGKDLLIVTRRSKDGVDIQRAHYVLDGEGLPTSFALDWKRRPSGETPASNFITRFTWTRVGERRRLSRIEIRGERNEPGRMPDCVATTLEYEEFDGIAVPTSWVTARTPDADVDADAEAGRRTSYRFTELSINGKSVALRAAPSKPKAADAKRPVQSTHISPALPIVAPGTYVHEGSGFAFPRSAAKFARVTANRYDEEGNDVGIGYRRMWSDVHIEVTVYVYPVKRRADGTPWTFDEQFDGEAAALREGHEDVKEIGRSNAPSTCAGRTVATRTAEFQIRGAGLFGERPVTSYLAAFRLEPWHVKYRVTATLERREEARAATEALLAELHLPPLNAPAAKDAEKR